MNGIGHSWAGLLRSYEVSDETASRLIRSLVATEVASLAFCRLLDRWAKGEPEPPTAGRREAALRRAAERVETALAGLERPLGQYLIELRGDGAEGRSWYGEPGRGGGARVGRRPAPRRRPRVAEPRRAGLPRAGRPRARPPGPRRRRAMGSPPQRAALWAGLFDLRENLYDGAVDDLRALAA